MPLSVFISAMTTMYMVELVLLILYNECQILEMAILFLILKNSRTKGKG